MGSFFIDLQKLDRKNLTSGGAHVLSVVVFEKSKLLSCKETIESLIQRRYNNTNVTANTDRVIEALNNNK